jgi:hypothetical protein
MPFLAGGERKHAKRARVAVGAGAGKGGYAHVHFSVQDKKIWRSMYSLRGRRDFSSATPVYTFPVGRERRPAHFV